MDAPIYVPVVKAKRNDIASLGGVVPANRPAIRPLLELAEYSSSDCDQILGALVTRLARFTWPHAPYVDLYSFLPDARVASGVNDDWLTALNGFRTRGIGVLLVEYPGYGRSSGKPSESAIRAAMDAGYDRISEDPRVDGARIFGFGESLGGGAICLLARDRHLRALILQSTFPSLDIFAARYWAPAFLLRDHFDSYSSVANFSGPVLVIHGSHDQLIPWQEGKRLAMASPRSTFKLYACGHGCWEPERLPFWQDAVPFLIGSGILDRR